MKYFNFFYQLNAESNQDFYSEHQDTINEIVHYSGFLSRNYEFCFPSFKTNKISCLTVNLVDSYIESNSKVLLSTLMTYAKIELNVFQNLENKEKTLYILKLCQQAIINVALDLKWDLTPFEKTFEKIKENQGLFRGYWKKTVLSPDKTLKAQVYFEDNYEKNGTYVDFIDNTNTLIRRVQFTPRGYSVYCMDIGIIKWQNNSQITINYLQVPKLGMNDIVNNSYYWVIDIGGNVDFNYIDTNEKQQNAQKLYKLGILHYEGKIIMQNKEKGLKLLKKSAELEYKHAKNWLIKYEKQFGND